MAGPLPKKDMTFAEVMEHDGKGPSGRILVVLNHKIFDVTEKGQTFYGKGGMYEMFAGREVSRAIAKMCMVARTTYDELEDLTPLQHEILKKWEAQFMEKYEFVGNLIQ